MLIFRLFVTLLSVSLCCGCIMILFSGLCELTNGLIRKNRTLFKFFIIILMCVVNVTVTN